MIEQTFIALFGVLAVFLTQQKNQKLTRYACLVGMSSQPFWLYATFIAQQWGMFFSSVMFTGVWALGIYNFWIAPWLSARRGRRLI